LDPVPTAISQTPQPPQITPHSPPQTPPYSPTPPFNRPQHPMTTRSKAGIVKTHHPFNMIAMAYTNLHVSLLAAKEPKGFKLASKHTHWCHAMTDEIQALHHNNTWTLVPRPPHTNVVGSKWVFRTKYHVDRTINRYKARLVAKVLHKYQVLIFLILLVPLLKPPCQSKYAHDILSRASLLDSKPIGTPLATNDIFTTDGHPFHDPTLY
nr:hypothetical protein [Tanacetum cinerariifolium]